MAKVGPVQGVRVPVKLPWKGAAHNNDQFVSIKKPVVEFLKLEIAKEKDLVYKGEIRYKKRDSDGNPTGALQTKKVNKIRRPGYKTRSIKVIFGDRKTGTPKKVVIGKDGRYSIDFPVTRSILISDIRTEFMTGQWKNLSVIRIVDTSTGQGYPIY